LAVLSLFRHCSGRVKAAVVSTTPAHPYRQETLCAPSPLMPPPRSWLYGPPSKPFSAEEAGLWPTCPRSATRDAALPTQAGYG
jgi:hypothetical protein